ncbi:MAG TPA: alpha/beta hydrolase [Gemmatimonadaceae bacterium]|jgi:predicted esterase
MHVDAEAPREWPHRWVPGAAGASSPTVVLLHGTGGDESDLIPLGAELAPGASLLSPRGPVSERGMPRFFRRHAEGVFDEADIRARVPVLAAFIRSAAGAYGFSLESLFALGYSNGANMAASLLLLEPGLLHGAALLRAVMPLEPATLPALAGTSVFISDGQTDPFSPPQRAQRLADALAGAGADVTLRWQRAGHELVPGDLEDTRRWLSQHLARVSA